MEAFLPFGTYNTLVDPKTTVISEKPIKFFRDIVQLGLGGACMPSFSTCRVEKRDPVIDITEYHTRCCEGILPLDNDALIHVGPAKPVGEAPPLSEFRVFHIPKGRLWP